RAVRESVPRVFCRYRRAPLPPSRRRRSRRNSVASAQPRSCSVRLCYKNGPFVSSGPPAEVRSELAEDPLEEIKVGLAPQRLLGPVEKDRGPAMHRRIDIAEVPLVGRDLSGRMEEKPHQQQVELLLGEIDVDGGERNSVKGQVP